MDHLTPDSLKKVLNIDFKNLAFLVYIHMQGVVNKQNEICKLFVFIMWLNKQ